MSVRRLGFVTLLFTVSWIHRQSWTLSVGGRTFLSGNTCSVVRVWTVKTQQDKLSVCSDKLIYFPRGWKAQSPPMTPKRGSPVFEFTIAISSGIFHSISCRYVAMSSAEWKFKNWGDADKLQMFTKYLQINLNIFPVAASFLLKSRNLFRFRS